MNKIAVIIRLILSVALLYLAYGETGPWTTVILALMFASAEITGFVLKGQAEFMKVRVFDETP